MAEPESALRELESLQAYTVVYDGNKVKAFTEWAREHADRLYPDVGTRGYVVPPIFVHKHSTRYNPDVGADVLQDYQKSSPKGEKAHSHVARSFALLSPRLDRPLFIISGLEYDNMLKWVRHHPHLTPALPDAVENRGDIDIMVMHRDYGVVFLQVKAVGDNEVSRTHLEIQKKIILGGRQLRKDDNILRWVLQDWPEATSCHVTHVVALPNLTRAELASFWPPSDLDPETEEAKNTEGVVFLCKDDLPTPEDPAKPEADMDVTSLMTWWTKHVTAVKKELSLPFMKDVVSRYVGMLSAVEVYAGNNLRKEVRLTSDAVNLCGAMFRRILLNEDQLRILSTPCQRRYLSGPPGSGKTVLLVLRARQFVRQGGHVVVINMYRGAAGRAIGHFIRDSVARFSVPQGHDGRKGKNKPKAKKKKGEDRLSGDATPPVTRKNPEATSPARAQVQTPPTQRKGQNGVASSPPVKSVATPPSSRKTPNSHPPQSKCQGSGKPQGTPPSARRKQNAALVNSGTPGTPPGGRKAYATSPRPIPQKTTPSKAMSANDVHSHIPSPLATPPMGTSPLVTPPKGTPPLMRKYHGTPPTGKKNQETIFDLSDSVHVVDVDIATSAFDQGQFENDIRHRLSRDVKPTDVMFVVDEIYVKEYWSDVLDVLNEGFPGCHIWCAGLYSRNPPGFEQEDLLHVLRCPPVVQKVLYAVDWDPKRRASYMLNTDCSGVYTAGLSPLSVRHQGHPQVSISECEVCAEHLFNLLHQGLGLSPSRSTARTASVFTSDTPATTNISTTAASPSTTEASTLNSDHTSSTATSPSTTTASTPTSDYTAPMASTTTITASSEADGVESSGLSCSDVVMLVNIPRALYEPDARGFLDTTKDDFKTYMAYLASCPLVVALRRLGVPVKVVEDLPCHDLHDLKDGQMAVAWAYTYQGLENKVVIYLPGDTPWTPETHDREIPAPGLCSTPRTQPRLWKPRKAQHLVESEGGGGGGDQQGVRGPLTSGRSSLAAGDLKSSGTVPCCSSGTSTAVSAGTCDPFSCCVRYTQWPSEEGDRSAFHKPVQGPASSLETEEEGQGSGLRSRSRVNLSEYWWREEDVKRYSNWDKSNLFVAGSRCLSQLIMLIP